MAAPLTAQVAVVQEAAASDCPGAEAFAARVNAILGRQALEPGPDPAPRGALPSGPAPTRLGVRLGREGGRRVARVVASGDLWGSREIFDDGESCEGLSEAVVTSLALMIESASSAGAGVESASSTGAGAAPPEPAPSDPLRVEASIGVLGAVGWLKGARPAGWAAVRVGWSERFGAALGFGYVVPASFSVDGVDVELGLFFGQAEGCFGALTSPALSLGLCAGGAVGGLSGRARGVEASSPRLQPWVAAEAGVVASGPSGPGLGWWGRLGGWVPLRKQGFHVEGVGPVFDPAPVAVGLGGGVRWSNW
jgi:hypothetical protein